MTMPERIWAYHGTGFEGEDIIAAHDKADPYGEEVVHGVEYIRADIAEELARALEEFGEYENWMAARWRAALARYRQAIAD